MTHDVASLVIVVSAVLVLRADKQTQTDTDKRYTPASVVDVSNYVEPRIDI